MAIALLRRLLGHLHRQALREQTGGLADGDLLRRFLRDKDDLAFEAIVQRHGSMVYAVCRRLLKNPHDADDAFQATFLILLHKAKSLMAPQSVGNWLYGVAFRAAQQVRARNTRSADREQQLPDNVAEQQSAEPGALELREVLDEELSRLGAKYRAAVVLCDLEGGSRQEVAAQLGIPEGTLSSRLAMGRKLLGKRLARRGFEFSGSALGTALVEAAASAAVPSALRTALLQAGTLLAKGQALTAVTSTSVAQVTQGVLKTTLITRLQILCAGLLMLAGLTTAGLGAGGLFSDKHADADPIIQKTSDFAKPRDDGKARDAKQQTIGLGSIYSTSIQNDLKKQMTAVFLSLPNGGSKPAFPYTYDLDVIRKKAGSVGASNVFLVRGNNIVEAITATRHALTDGELVDTPPQPDTDDRTKSAEFWLVVYLGPRQSEPPAWVVESVILKNTTIEFRYRQPINKLVVHDFIQYFYWVPLGEMTAGTYELRLFNMDHGNSTLTRWVTIPRK